MHVRFGLALSCALLLHAQVSWTQEKTNTVEVSRYDDRNEYAGGHLDYSAMLQYCSQKLEQFADRLEAMGEAEELEELTLTEDEETDVIIAYGYFLIALLRMQQEVACLIDNSAAAAVSTIWYTMGSLFTVFPKEVQLQAVGEVLEYIEEHGDESWQATAELEHYKPAAEWQSLREEATQNFVAFLQNLANELQ